MRVGYDLRFSGFSLFLCLIVPLGGYRYANEDN
jgi:hypothetical protein